MTEWGVFLVIVALIGFAGAIISPVIKLNTSITTLNITMRSMGGELDKLSSKNSQSHDRIWEELGEQENELKIHEKRIGKLENSHT